jgi:FtsH-binding integral membrane protein
MYYELRQPLAQEAARSARAAFIRRTYGHLAGAILGFIALETCLLQIPGVENFIGAMLSPGMALVIFLGFWGVSALANHWAYSETSRDLQYVGLVVYTVATAVLFLPLLYFATRYYPQAIPVAGGLTLAVFGGLTLTVFVTRTDFSYLQPILTVGSLLALGFIVCGIIFGFSLELFFCLAMVALLSGYILFYTSAVLHHYRTDQHVAASLALFASVATLFWYILRIVMIAGSSRQ